MLNKPKSKMEMRDRRKPELLDDRKLHEMIARRAYDLFEKRGREEGHECEDWLEAERQLLVDLESEPARHSGLLASTHRV